MTDQASLKKEITALVRSQLLTVLSTHREGQPYASLVAFIASEDLGSIYFATGRATRKFKNMEQDRRVALLIDNRSNQENDFHNAAAITVIGKVRELEQENRANVETRYLSRHPYLEEFVKAPTTALMNIQVSRYIMVTRFQEVLELHLGD